MDLFQFMNRKKNIFFDCFILELFLNNIIGGTQNFETFWTRKLMKF